MAAIGRRLLAVWIFVALAYNRDKEIVMRFSTCCQCLLFVGCCFLAVAGFTACQTSDGTPPAETPPAEIPLAETPPAEIPSAEIITIGVINYRPPTEPTLDGFKAGMEEFGYVEGSDIEYIYNGPVETLAELDEIARGFVEAEVDLILAIASVSASAAQTATLGTDIPVVFAPVTDPLGSGLVAELAEPGANVTGVTNGGSESRRLEWLLELAPPDTRLIYVPYNPEDPSPQAALLDAQAAAAELGVELLLYPARNDAQMTAAANGIPPEADAIFMLPDSVALAHTDEFIAAALERGLPFSAPTSEQVVQGALVSFGINLFEIGRQAARLADQILDGQDPGGLPVEEAEFFLVINLKTAEAIGLEIPDEILSQATRLIRE
jgi:putative tryptophan/tyrosine transport system substrate-binding protein